jgi:hypothetical protein
VQDVSQGQIDGQDFQIPVHIGQDLTEVLYQIRLHWDDLK